ncbi:FAD-binding protein [Shimazuella alba]|uniref:FAD-binding protein n=1 Tax=Shimazuella alba TaxID=2690964 RepID=A0A6I4VU79_9BACL|nr:FAD-binding protein [Shimazuella alba]MXQ54071.1 FAD-binding protein [Shimazuella alba]
MSFSPQESPNVIGLDTSTGSWITSEEPISNSFQKIPQLDGNLVLDPLSLKKASQDQGNYITRIPSVILQPSSHEDIVKMLRFCNKHHIRVAPQGARHTTYGQATVDRGLAIDMTFLNTISIGNETAWVGAGVLWRDFVRIGESHGVQPASSTPDYLGLTIAGTVSVGGFTPRSYIKGNIADNVRSMKVVTGKGDLVQCSRDENQTLFRAMQGTLGQFGIIVELEIEIIPAPKMIRTYTLGYPNLDVFMRDLNTLADRAEAGGLFGMFQPNDTGLVPLLMVDVEYDSVVPDDNHILRGLEVTTPVDATNRTYLERAEFFDKMMEKMEVNGWGKAIKPWYDMIVAAEDVPKHFQETIGTLKPSDISPTTFILLFPAKVLDDRSPYLRIPEKVVPRDRVCLIDLLDDNTGNTHPEYSKKKLTRNNEWANLAEKLGGVSYPIGTRTMDWKKHYGSTWDSLNERKKQFDPKHILIGAHIFS